MTIARTTLAMLVAALLLTATGCVVISGQRLAVRHDVKNDRIEMLLFYDGIYNRSDRPSEKEDAKFKKFVANGDVMFLDWFGHMKMEGLSDAVEQPDEDHGPATRKFIVTLAESLRTKPIGYYKDVKGRLGAAQMVTLNKVSKLLPTINAAINENVSAASVFGGDDDFGRTLRLMVTAAKNGHTWAALKEGRLTVTLPMDQREWTRLKGEGISHFFNRMVSKAKRAADKPDRETKLKKEVRSLLQIVTAMPLGISEGKDQLVITVGHADGSPVILRTHLPDRNHNPNMDHLIRSEVKKDLDPLMTGSLNPIVDELVAIGPAAQAIMDWGPQEFTARLLMRKAFDGDKLYAQLLVSWGQKWNKKQRVPAAPTIGPDDADAFAGAWKKWHEQMLHYPLTVPKYPAPKKVEPNVNDGRGGGEPAPDDI
jgi:hypothetical protein